MTVDELKANYNKVVGRLEQIGFTDTEKYAEYKLVLELISKLEEYGLLECDISNPNLLNWQYCYNLNDINSAILNSDENWDGLRDASQITSIVYDSNHGCYVVFWSPDR